MAEKSSIITILKRLWGSKSTDRRNAPSAASGERFARIAELLGEPAGQLDLYNQALRHRSLLRRKTDTRLVSNERLEFLGDAVLGMVVAEHLYSRYRSENEGYLTKMRAKIVNGKSLATCARAIHLGELVLMSENTSSLAGRTNDSILADAFEAFIGAMYLDKGLPIAKKFIHAHVLSHLNLELLAITHTNFKSALQELVQGRGLPQPKYRVVKESGPSHARQFEIEVDVDGKPMGKGTAGSKKMAEQQAAKVALDLLSEPA